jgi:hypothetical protein
MPGHLVLLLQGLPGDTAEAIKRPVEDGLARMSLYEGLLAAFVLIVVGAVLVQLLRYASERTRKRRE